MKLEKTYRWAVKLANVHVLQKIPCLIRMTDILERFSRILPCSSENSNLERWDKPEVGQGIVYK